MKSPQNQFVVFALDDQRYALHLDAVDRAVRIVEIRPLPQAPEIVAGVINMQGRIIPVINLRRRFCLPERNVSLTDQIIVAHTARRLVGLVVDAAREVIECAEQDVAAAESVFPGLCNVEGVVKLQDGLVLIYDLDKFLSLEEEDSLDRALETA